MRACVGPVSVSSGAGGAWRILSATAKPIAFGWREREPGRRRRLMEPDVIAALVLLLLVSVCGLLMVHDV